MNGMERLCACHGKPMFVHKDARKPSGVAYRCRVKFRAINRRAVRKYYRSEKGQETNRRAARKYAGTLKGFAARMRRQAKARAATTERMREGLEL